LDRFTVALVPGAMPAQLPGHVSLLTLKPRHTVRFAIAYGGVRRALLWLNVGDDGSIYLGITRPAGVAFVGSKALGEDGKVQLKYDEGKQVTAEELRRHRHFSLHPSGQDNAAGRTTFRDEWRTLRVPTQLCNNLLDEPIHYPALPNAPARAMDLHCHVDGSRPLSASLFVAPSPQVVGLSRTEEEIGVAFNVTEQLNGMRPLAVQLIIHTMPPGPWLFGTFVTSMRKVSPKA
jgi:hypothetical protein